MRRGCLLGALLAVALAPAAQGSCTVGTTTDFDAEAECGPLNPPPDPEPGTVPPPPRIVAWTGGYDINPFGGFRGGIYVAKVSGSDRRKIVSFTHRNRDFDEHGLNLPDDHPSFSPDNRRLVFTSNRANATDWDIHRMLVNGTGITRLAPAAGLDTEPVYSPNGAKIAFATQRFSGVLDIAVMDANGTNVQRLTTDSHDDNEPAWSPDGSQIVFTRVMGEGEKDVFLINADGTNERRITSAPGEDHDATFSPDGKQLVITTERPPFSVPYGNVHKISVDGTDIADLTADQSFASGDPFWSRDGGLVAFFHASLGLLNGPQALFVMNSSGGQKSKIPGEVPANIHPAIGLGVDDDKDGTPNYLESGSVGRTHVRPRAIRGGRTTTVGFWWRHPRRWRRLETMDLGLVGAQRVLAVVRYRIADRTFALYDREAREFGRARDGGILRSGPVMLDLRRTGVVEVDRRTLRLDLALRVATSARGRYRLAVQANDRGGRNQIDRLGRLTVR